MDWATWPSVSLSLLFCVNISLDAIFITNNVHFKTKESRSRTWCVVLPLPALPLQNEIVCQVWHLHTCNSLNFKCHILTTGLLLIPLVKLKHRNHHISRKIYGKISSELIVLNYIGKFIFLIAFLYLMYGVGRNFYIYCLFGVHGELNVLYSFKSYPDKLYILQNLCSLESFASLLPPENLSPCPLSHHRLVNRRGDRNRKQEVKDLWHI